MPDGREELLMPAAQNKGPAVSHVVHPDMFVLHLEPEGAGVTSNTSIQQRQSEFPGDETVLFICHRGLFFTIVYVLDDRESYRKYRYM